MRQSAIKNNLNYFANCIKCKLEYMSSNHSLIIIESFISLKIEKSSLQFLKCYSSNRKKKSTNPSLISKNSYTLLKITIGRQTLHTKCILCTA